MKHADSWVSANPSLPPRLRYMQLSRAGNGGVTEENGKQETENRKFKAGKRSLQRLLHD